MYMQVRIRDDRTYAEGETVVPATEAEDHVARLADVDAVLDLVEDERVALRTHSRQPCITHTHVKATVIVQLSRDDSKDCVQKCTYMFKVGNFNDFSLLK